MVAYAGRICFFFFSPCIATVCFPKRCSFPHHPMRLDRKTRSFENFYHFPSLYRVLCVRYFSESPDFAVSSTNDFLCYCPRLGKTHVGTPKDCSALQTFSAAGSAHYDFLGQTGVPRGADRATLPRLIFSSVPSSMGTFLHRNALQIDIIGQAPKRLSPTDTDVLLPSLRFFIHDDFPPIFSPFPWWLQPFPLDRFRFRDAGTPTEPTLLRYRPLLRRHPRMFFHRKRFLRSKPKHCRRLQRSHPHFFFPLHYAVPLFAPN